jgi:hypothetical protein
VPLLDRDELDSARLHRHDAVAVDALADGDIGLRLSDHAHHERYCLGALRLRREIDTGGAFEMSGQEEEQGGLAVPGPESHEAGETLSPDERGAKDQPAPPATETVSPSTAAQPSLWDRIMGKLRG